MTVLKFTNGKPYTALKSLYSDVPGPQFNPEPYAAQSVTSRVPFINIAES